MSRIICALILISGLGARTFDVAHRRRPVVTPTAEYAWTALADSAAFPGAYNFPVFVVRNHMRAFHPCGNWFSNDAKMWTRSELPLAGLNSGYQKYVLLNDAVYALGTMEGNYLNMRLGSRITRTRDFKRWEVVAEQSNLPRRVFYGAVVDANKIWLMGGFDGIQYYDDVWNSPDGVHWTRVTEHAGWSPRNVDLAIVFKNRIWIIGGGVIDGQPEINPSSKREAWSSADGVHWRINRGHISAHFSWLGPDHLTAPPNGSRSRWGIAYAHGTRNSSIRYPYGSPSVPAI